MSRARFAAGVAVALTVLGGVSVNTQADATVLPHAPVTAHAGPVKAQLDGRARCTKPGWSHFEIDVHTTGKNGPHGAIPEGEHVAAVWVQYHAHGRARLAGWNHSTSADVPVVACIKRSAVDGGSGPVYAILEDVVDGRTRPVRVKFTEVDGKFIAAVQK